MWIVGAGIRFSGQLSPMRLKRRGVSARAVMRGAGSGGRNPAGWGVVGVCGPVGRMLPVRVRCRWCKMLLEGQGVVGVCGPVGRMFPVECGVINLTGCCRRAWRGGGSGWGCLREEAGESLKNKPLPPRGSGLRCGANSVYLTALTICSNAWGWFIARSASTLRLRLMPLALSLPINSE